MRSWRSDAFAITERNSDRVIGIIQTPMLWWRRTAEMGYWLVEDARGKGYMTEAVEAVKEHLFETFMICDEIRIYVSSSAVTRRPETWR